MIKRKVKILYSSGCDIDARIDFELRFMGWTLYKWSELFYYRGWIWLDGNRKFVKSADEIALLKALVEYERKRIKKLEDITGIMFGPG